VLIGDKQTMVFGIITSLPHVAGSSGEFQMAHCVRQQFQENGLAATIDNVPRSEFSLSM